MWLIAFPIFIPIVSHVQSPLTLFHVLGGVVFFTGFLIESIADWQLSQFKKNSANKGKIMTQGLWSRSRHPNYFGEILVWWGIFIYTLPLSHGWIGVVSPITLTFLLVKVSGVPMLERKYEGNIQYEKYKQTTPRLWLF